jgi:mRNA interferase MazF
MINQRDLLLVPFPFSDQSGRKVRPVIVVSNDEFNKYSEDIIVVGMTSNIIKTKYTTPIANSDLEEGKLITPCCIKAENILKLDKEMIIKKIGKIKENKSKQIFEMIVKMVKV